MTDFKQILSNLPQSILDAPRFVPVEDPESRKPLSGLDWPMPNKQRKYNEWPEKFQFMSFVVTQQKEFDGYDGLAFINMNSVLDEHGNFVNTTAEEWYNKLHASGFYCEKSFSGRGLHIIIQPKINDDLPAGKFKVPLDDNDENIYIEATYRTPWTCLVTGDCFDCPPKSPIVTGDTADNMFLQIISAATGKPLSQLLAERPKDGVIDIPAQHAKFRIAVTPRKFRDSLSADELERVKRALRDVSPEEFASRLNLDKARDGGYICPNPDCSNGAGSNGTGIKPKYWSGHWEWHCYKCDSSWDNIGLIADFLGLSMQGKDYIEVIKKGAEMFGIGYTTEGDFVTPTYVKNFTPPKEEPKPVKDYTNFYYKVACPNLPKFLAQCGGTWRNFTRETLEYFHCGYTDDFILYHAPAVIIPYTKNHYFARFVGDKDKLTSEQKSKLAEKYHTKGEKPIFNAKRALGNDNPICFVVESATDAMSIYQASGRNVIAVSGSNLSSVMRDQLKTYTAKKFIVMLDGDATGQSKKQKLVDQLIELGNQATAITLSDVHKDANDFLQADSDGLAARLKEIYDAAAEFFAKPQPAAKPAPVVDTPALAVDSAVEEWQSFNGVISPDVLPRLADAKNYLDALTPADITPGVAKSAKVKHSVALCNAYDCYADSSENFFANLDTAKRNAAKEFKNCEYQKTEPPVSVVALKNLGITELKEEINSLIKAYKKAHKEFIKSEKQRKVREKAEAARAAHAAEINDLQTRLETLKSQQQCKERDAAIVDTIRQLCTWKRDKLGNPVSVEANQANADLIFCYDPDFDGLFAYDEFQQKDVFLKAPPWNNRVRRGDDWQDADDDQLCVTLRRIYAEFSNKEITAQTFTAFSRKRRFHTIQEYFKNLPAWDGKPRAETLFIDWLKVDDTAFAREVTMNWLTAAVARIFHPGCRYQTALVLPGNQGIGKSFILERLGGEWHDTLTDAIDDPHALDAIRKMWLCEIKEGAAWKKADADAQKRFIDTAKDTRRVAYGKHATTYLRQNVIAITINGKQFLSDLTGNRRYMILQANLAQGCYPEQVRGERLTDDNVIKQIWAEVYAHYNTLFANGFDEKKLELSREMKLQIENVAQEYTRDDDIKGELQAALDTKILPSVVWDLMTQAERRDFMVTKSFCIEEIALETRFKGLGDKKRAKLQDAFDAATTMSTFVQRADVRDKKTNLYRTHFIFYGTEYRQHICPAEVRAEFFDKTDRRLTSSKILDLLEQTDGWAKGKKIYRASEYGTQANVYYRDTDNIPTDDEPTDSPPPARDYDDFGGDPIDPQDCPLFDTAPADTAPVTDAAPVVDKPVETMRHGINLNSLGYNEVEAKKPDHAAPFDPDDMPF